jgi:hypothetical protein
MIVSSAAILKIAFKSHLRWLTTLRDSDSAFDREKPATDRE